MKRLPIKQRISPHVAVAAALKVVIDAQTRFRKTLCDSEHLLAPEQRVETYRRLLSELSDAREIDACMSRIAALESPAAQLAKQRAQDLCLQAQDTFKSKLPALLDAGDVALAEL